MWSLINVSSNLHTTDVKLTGLFFSGLFLDPFLNSGVYLKLQHRNFFMCMLSNATTNLSY